MISQREVDVVALLAGAQRDQARVGADRQREADLCARFDEVAEYLKGSQPVSKARVHGWIKAARERTEARD